MLAVVCFTFLYCIFFFGSLWYFFLFLNLLHRHLVSWFISAHLKTLFVFCWTGILCHGLCQHNKEQYFFLLNRHFVSWFILAQSRTVFIFCWIVLFRHGLKQHTLGQYYTNDSTGKLKSTSALVIDFKFFQQT